MEHPKKGIISPTLLEALRAVRTGIECGRPRRVDVRSSEVLYIFTDAAFASDSKTGGLGGVLMSGSGEVIEWFGLNLNEKTCLAIMDENQEQAIGELETLAVYVALKKWERYLASKHVVVFLDNDSARYSILRGDSKNKQVAQIARGIALLEEAMCCFAWYSRVPTEANVADHPSRDEPCDRLDGSTRATVEGLEADLREIMNSF